MPPATEAERTALEPYILGARADNKGEIEMHCPLHGDNKRSASVNFEKGVWYCHAGVCGGGSIRQLVASEDVWRPILPSARRRHLATVGRASGQESYGIEDIDRWHERLLDDRYALDALWDEKGITTDTARRARLGWNGRYFKLPVFGPERELWNIRTYDMNPTNGRRKIWSIKGMGSARLYPVGTMGRALRAEAVLFCEGEWDTLLALQAGYHAVTRTDGAGKPWREEWTEQFRGLRVYICQDRDEAGIKSAESIGAALRGVAETVRFCNLPYPVAKSKGKDLSDFLLESEKPQWLQLGALMKDSTKEILL